MIAWALAERQRRRRDRRQRTRGELREQLHACERRDRPEPPTAREKQVDMPTGAGVEPTEYPVPSPVARPPRILSRHAVERTMNDEMNTPGICKSRAPDPSSRTKTSSKQPHLFR
ncbi:unnamed protein product [Boreogadus saida]